MSESSKVHITAAWIVGILGIVGAVLAAIIGLGQPVIQRLTNTPIVIVVTATPPTGIIAQTTSQPSKSTIATPTLLPTLTRAVVPTTSPTLAPTITAPSVAALVPICGKQQFKTDFLGDGKANVELNFPGGYVYAFITSDPALVEFSNGTRRLFSTQFVLITKDFTRVTIKSVGTKIENGTRVVNTYACIYANDAAQVAEQTARKDYNIKITNGFLAELYRVDLQGFTLLDSNLNK